MPKVDRVLSTPPTKTSDASTPGAVRLSPPPVIPLSPSSCRAGSQTSQNQPRFGDSRKRGCNEQEIHHEHACGKRCRRGRCSRANGNLARVKTPKVYGGPIHDMTIVIDGKEMLKSPGEWFFGIATTSRKRVRLSS
jgi:hypothetical protein